MTVNRMIGNVIDESKAATLTIEDLLVVSIGDSAASGEGNPDVPGIPKGFDYSFSWWDVLIIPGFYHLTEAALNWAHDQLAENETQLARDGNMTIAMDPSPVWLESLAHRSLRSGHAFAAGLLENLTAGTVVTFLPFGRTGSEIPNGLIGPRTSGSRQADPWIGNIGQIAEVANTLGQRQIDALLIYVGADDMHVAHTLESLVTGDAPILGQNDATQARKDATAAGKANLAALGGKLDQLATALKSLNVSQVYLTEYPTGLFDDKNGNPAHGCEVFSGPDLNLSVQDATLVKNLAQQLNAELATAANRHNWIYVGGIDQAFNGHGYCTSGDRRYFIQCAESLVTQGDTDGTIHPNYLGHETIGRIVAQTVLKTIGTSQPVMVTTAAGPVPGPPGTGPLPAQALETLEKKNTPLLVRMMRGARQIFR